MVRCASQEMGLPHIKQSKMNAADPFDVGKQNIMFESPQKIRQRA